MPQNPSQKINGHTLRSTLRLDHVLVARGMVESRSRAESYIRAGSVVVNGDVERRASRKVSPSDSVAVSAVNPYVSRAALKLVGANKKFKVDFDGKVVLDIGSSTGGFTHYALMHGAKKVIAVDVGTNQMHPSVSADERVELHEKTDIREFACRRHIDIVVCDVSFVSLRLIIPSVLKLVNPDAKLILMCKPQFEAGKRHVNKGVIKNESIRRKILADFEAWLKTMVVVLDKVDSDTPGEKGNVERFFLAKKLVK